MFLKRTHRMLGGILVNSVDIVLLNLQIHYEQNSTIEAESKMLALANL